jgi:hypothetical protein
VARPPRGVPDQLIPQFRHLIRDVFTHSYIAAIRPTLAISVAFLLAGAGSCLLLRRHTAAVTSPPATIPGPAAASTGPAPAAIPAGPALAATPATTLAGLPASTRHKSVTRAHRPADQKGSLP